MKNSLCHSRRSGFTLIEMMVAIAILLTMLTIILVPLRLGLDSFALGKTRAETQGSLGSTISAIEKDLRRAVIVFPNSELAGVTTQAPYYRSLDTTDTFASPTTPLLTPLKRACDVYSTTAERWSNPSRIDMIVALRSSSNGNLKSPIEAGDTLISYYPRRLDVSKAYDPVDNPVVLFRAEIPFRTRDSATNSVTEIDVATSTKNADVSSARYPSNTDCSAAPEKNRSSLWLAHNFYGEANLEPLTKDVKPPQTTDVERSHGLAMPRGLGLVVTNAGCNNDPCAPGASGLVPESTFSTADTNGDGKIDRVNISLAFTSFDASSSNRLRNNQPVGQQLRASRTVDLPNIQ